MKKLILSVISLLFMSLPYSGNAGEYSLMDLWTLSLQNSESVKISEEDLFISERERDMARAALLPRLSAFGNHTRYTEEKRQAGFVLQPGYTNEWGVRLDQSFSLSGREFTAYKIASDAITRSGYTLDSVQEEYLLIVAAAYFDVLKSMKSLDIARANVERLTKHRDAAGVKLRVGDVTKTVLLRAEAELAGAEAEVIRAENSLELAKAVLSQRAGIEREYTLSESRIPVQTHELGGECDLAAALRCLTEVALSERSEIKSLKQAEEMAEDEVKYARGSYWPTLSLEGEYFRQEDEPSSTFGLEERIYAGLKLNFPFFEGGLKRAEVSAAKARQRQARYRLADMEDLVRIDVEHSYLNMMTMSGLLKKLGAEVAYASDNYNAVSKQFEYGLADSVDVMDANTLLLTSERELASAGYDHQLALLRLKRATGMLLRTIQGPQLTDAREDTDKK